MRMCIMQCREKKRSANGFNFKRRRQGFTPKVIILWAAILFPPPGARHRDGGHREDEGDPGEHRQARGRGAEQGEAGRDSGRWYIAQKQL